MKIPKITSEDILVNVKLKMHQSTVELINIYQDTYKKEYNEDLDMGKFLEHVGKQFINSDKEFIASIKKQKEIKVTSKIETKAKTKKESIESQPSLGFWL